MATTSRKTQRDEPPTIEEGLRAKGMYRVQIEESGEIVGDSGWKENVITNLGFNLYLVGALGKIAGSGQIGYLALGTGTYPASADTTLSGEVSNGTARQTVTAASSSTSKTIHFTGTFASSNNFLGASSNIANIGLFNTASAFGTLFSGNTYASSAVATNQNVNCFTAGHALETVHGTTMAIENVREGDMLMGYNEETGELEPTRVVACGTRFVDETLELTFDSGLSLRCTEEHPLHVGQRDGWVLASDLRIGDEVSELVEHMALANGDALIEVESVTERVAVYNVQCAPHANYFVEGLLAHNCSYDITFS